MDHSGYYKTPPTSKDHYCSYLNQSYLNINLFLIIRYVVFGGNMYNQCLKSLNNYSSLIENCFFQEKIVFKKSQKQKKRNLD
jgi:hypothetical protein